MSLIPQQFLFGLGQGCATSCVLFNLAMYAGLQSRVNSSLNCNLYTYADDGYVASSQPMSITELSSYLDPYSGLRLSPEKCEVNKQNGIWLKSFKYLGLRFIPAVLPGDALTQKLPKMKKDS